jgi:histidinol-phosphate/aromatic aminotransferase/cobyric acid decarboxylase-like protein
LRITVGTTEEDDLLLGALRGALEPSGIEEER